MSGQSSLEAFIERVESLRTINETVAKEAEKDVVDVARQSARAAETPNGEPWPELKDGGKALHGAANAIKSTVKGNRIVLTIGKPFVFHQHGAGGSSKTKQAVRDRKRTSERQASTGTKSKFHSPRRQILPTAEDSTPKDMSEAIEAASKRVFENAMGR